MDVLGQIPASFYTQIESKKWSDRKEALEIVEKATNVPKIQNADYSELVRVLKKTVAKDSNIVVVVSAAKCLCQLAQALRSNFSPYTSCLTVLFEKFKEKKPNVISVIRDATDAVFVATNLENIYEEVIQFLDNKNPQIKSEMALFLARTFSKYPSQVMNKKTLRPLINALIKTLSDMDATVRDNSAMAIGTAMKVTGEKLMMTFIADVEPIKIPKIKEFCEKAQVKKLPKTAINTMTAQPPALPPPAPPSSATMVRRPGPAVNRSKVGALPKIAAPKPPQQSIQQQQQPQPNATVKRNATIIKRSVATKRTSMGAPPGPVPQPQVPTHAPAPTVNNNHQLQQPALLTPAKPHFAASQHHDVGMGKQALSVTTNNNSHLDVLKLISDSDNEIFDSLKELENTITDEQTLRGHINQIIYLSCLQLIISIDSQRNNRATNPTSNYQKIQKTIDCIIKLFSRGKLVATASQHSIRFLLVQIFTLIQTCNNMTNDDEEIIVKGLDTLVTAVLDAFEPANMMCILSGLLNDPPPSSIVDSVKEAIIRSMKSFK